MPVRLKMTKMTQNDKNDKIHHGALSRQFSIVFGRSLRTGKSVQELCCPVRKLFRRSLGAYTSMPESTSRLPITNAQSCTPSFYATSPQLCPTLAEHYARSDGEAHDSGVCPQRARCSGRRASVQRPSVLVSQVGASVRS